MKNLIILITVIFLTSCGPSKEQVEAEKKRVSDSMTDAVKATLRNVDSIQSRFDFMKELLALGISKENAERMADSVDRAIKHPEEIK